MYLAICIKFYFKKKINSILINYFNFEFILVCYTVIILLFCGKKFKACTVQQLALQNSVVMREIIVIMGFCKSSP